MKIITSFSLNKDYLEATRVEYLRQAYFIANEMIMELEENSEELKEKGCTDDFFDGYYECLENVINGLTGILKTEGADVDWSEYEE